MNHVDYTSYVHMVGMNYVSIVHTWLQKTSLREIKKRYAYFTRDKSRNNKYSKLSL